MSGDSKGIIEDGYLHGISACLLLLAVRIGDDIGVGGDLQDLLALLKDWLGVLACYLEVLDLPLLALLVVDIDLEGSLIHRFRLLGTLLQVVRLSKQVLRGIELLLLYPEGQLLLQGLADLVEGLFLLLALQISLIGGLFPLGGKWGALVGSDLIFADCFTDFDALLLECFELAGGEGESGEVALAVDEFEYFFEV